LQPLSIWGIFNLSTEKQNEISGEAGMDEGLAIMEFLPKNHSIAIVSFPDLSFIGKKRTTIQERMGRQPAKPDWKYQSRKSTALQEEESLYPQLFTDTS
jgi:hypothetical protein